MCRGIIAPLGIVALFAGRKKKGSKVGTFMVLLLAAGSIGMTLAGCGGGQVTVTATSTPGAPVTYVATFEDGTTVTGTLPPSSGSPTEVLGVPCQTPETPIPEPTSTPVPTSTGLPFFVSGRYERTLAVQFAIDNADDYLDKNILRANPRDCTNFVSYALLEGGLLPTSEWYPSLNSTSWVNTSALFKFLGTKGFTPSPEFFNTDDYRDNRSSNPNAQLNYLRLRENTNDMINQNGLVKMRWSDFMLQIHNIQPGDLVFYKDTSGQWSHVAMVSEAWVDQTNYLWNGTGIPEPRIVEHSGPITAPVRPFRTMGDSKDEFLMSVQILFAP